MGPFASEIVAALIKANITKMIINPNVAKNFGPKLLRPLYIRSL